MAQKDIRITYLVTMKYQKTFAYLLTCVFMSEGHWQSGARDCLLNKPICDIFRRTNGTRTERVRCIKNRCSPLFYFISNFIYYKEKAQDCANFILLPALPRNLWILLKQKKTYSILLVLWNPRYDMNHMKVVETKEKHNVENI